MNFMNFEYGDLLRNYKAKENETIAQHTENLIRQANLLKNLGYISEDIAQVLITACYYHDFGKVNKEFQYRINHKTKFDAKKEVPHNILSLFFIDKDKCGDYYDIIFFAVLYHHYRVDGRYTNYIKENYNLIKENLSDIIKIPNTCFKMIKNVDFVKNEFNKKERKLLGIRIKGLLNRCDYSASANVDCEIKNDFLNDILLNWKENKDIKYNELQKFCLQHTNDNIIVTAPTGSGKTEAGLLWCGNNKCFFVLPLRSAINAMYDRIKELSGEDYENRVALLHSDMTLYYYENNINTDSDNDDLKNYCNDSRFMKLPITVCTPDQIFDFVLKYPGYEYKLAISSYSKFIIDEIQMYDPDLLASIIYAIKMIHTMGGKIAILTATLPPFVRDKLEEIFGGDIPRADFSQYGDTRHNINVQEKILESDDVYSIIENTKSDIVKKYLVICNSIDTTVKLYDELKDRYKDSNIKVNLLHARFIKKDRANKEKEILKAPKDRATTEIWISTSLVEASLDVDFDILITELSDLFSLFQRMGRVNRKGKKDYSKTNTYIFTELQGNAKKYKMTDKTIYSLSKEAIMSVSGVIDEVSKVNLIEKYLSTEKINMSEYVKKFYDAYNYISDLFDYEKSKNESKLRNIDTVDVIPEEIYETEVKNKNLTDRELRNLTVSVPRYNVKERKYIVEKLKGNKFPILSKKAYIYNKDRGLIKNIESGQDDDLDNFI